MHTKEVTKTDGKKTRDKQSKNEDKHGEKRNHKNEINTHETTSTGKTKSKTKQTVQKGEKKEEERGERSEEERGRASKSKEERARERKSEQERGRASKSEQERGRASKSEQERARARKSEEERGRASKSEEERARASKSEQERGRARKSEEERARASKSEQERTKTRKPRVRKSEQERGRASRWSKIYLRLGFGFEIHFRERTFVFAVLLRSSGFRWCFAYVFTYLLVFFCTRECLAKIIFFLGLVFEIHFRERTFVFVVLLRSSLFRWCFAYMYFHFCWACLFPRTLGKTYLLPWLVFELHCRERTFVFVVLLRFRCFSVLFCQCFCIFVGFFVPENAWQKFSSS